MTSVEFHFDFGSPNAYLSHRVLPAIAERTGAVFEYVPVLLGGVFKLTNNRSPVESFAGIRNKMEYSNLEMTRFVRRHGIVFKFNPFFPVNTLALMRGALAARRLGVFDAYVSTVFDNMWVEPKKMDDPEVLRGVLQAASFDVARLLALTEDPEVKRELVKNTERSVEMGAFGSPTFFVGKDIYFGKDRLGEVEAAIVSRREQP